MDLDINYENYDKAVMPTKDNIKENQNAKRYKPFYTYQKPIHKQLLYSLCKFENLILISCKQNHF